MNQQDSTDWQVADTFVLSEINLYNWGPFGGRHCIPVHEQGTAVIGPTGSGKTTVIDALMTLIVAQPRYNLASSGGHESDRSLMSYVRGVSGGGDETGETNLTARPAKTVTGISTTFKAGSKAIQLAAVIWIDSASHANADRKDLWIVCEHLDQSLDDWLLAHHEGGARRLKQTGRETPGLRVFDTKRAYLAHVRRFFEVGDNAFMLLNRAAGLKQLNSVDEIFRELVLDDHAMFEQAAEVVRSFDDLTAIHDELRVARDQQQSLLPLKAMAKSHAEFAADLEALLKLEKLQPIWFALQGAMLWSQRCALLETELGPLSESIDQSDVALRQGRRIADQAHANYLQQGGASIEQIKGEQDRLRPFIAERQANASQYQQVAASLGLEGELSRGRFQSNHDAANELQRSLTSDAEVVRASVDKARAARQLVSERLAGIEADIVSAEARPDSNIPANFQKFRQALAEAMSMSETEIPYVAELVEVKQEEQGWRGAIERAIGGHRLRLLVPEVRMQEVLRWVNERDNKLFVRLQQARSNSGPADFFQDGFARKLNFKSHDLRDSMKQLIAQIDRHCVNDTEALRSTPYAVTREGTMSARAGQFEKRDEHSLSSGWVTGFSNKDLLRGLKNSLQEAQVELASCEEFVKSEEDQLRRLNHRVLLCQQLADLSYEKVDVMSLQADLDVLQAQIASLAAPDSDASKAKRAWEDARERCEELDAGLKTLGERRAVLNEQIRQARGLQEGCVRRSGDGLSEEQLAFVGSRVKAISDADQLDDAERQATERVARRLGQNREQVQALEKSMVRQMEKAQQCDTGALVDYSTEIGEISAYLERLEILEKEALPEKLDRFLSYLNQASDQGVNQMLSEVDGEVSRIEERIEALNQTLRRVDFQDGRFLQLAPSRVRHASLHELERARERLRSASLAEDDQGNAHYAALKEVVRILNEASDNRTQVRSRALLDPRYRLQFAYEVLERETGETVDRRTSSKGGSGGEKEIIASYILTASLSYALCPDDATKPLFGTIVLDEAFSKSSQLVAGRIIAALKEFGLHALFVTPNKEMQLLRQHTRSAALIHRKGFQSSVVSLSWQEIDLHAKKIRGAHEPEKAG